MERLSTVSRHVCPYKQLKPAIRVTVTGAAGNIGYALIFMIGQGRMFGPEQPVNLTLLELPNAKKILEGTLMELRDCSLPLISELRGSTDLKEGFTGCEVAVLVGAKPRGPGMERKDLLGQNGQIFKAQGEALNQYASKNVKVCVVGNPANTNAMICSHYAPSIPKENFTALTRLDQARGEFQLAEKIGCHHRQIRNLIIWGNHSATQFPDASQGEVVNFPTQGVNTSIRGAVCDDSWLQNTFVDTVAKRGAAIIAQREKSSAASAASATCDHVHDWLLGTQSGQFVSMCVISDGSYGVPKGLCFSYPVTCQPGGKWTIIQGLKWDEFSKKKIDITLKELIEERDTALAYLSGK